MNEFAEHITLLAKGNERFVFLWDEASRAELLQTIGRFASNPELSLTWYDAANLAQAVRKTK